jgi:hypothetical protein
MAESADLGLHMPIPGRAGPISAVGAKSGAGLEMPTPHADEPQGNALRLRCVDGEHPGTVYRLPELGGLVGRRDDHEAIDPVCDLTDQEREGAERSVSRRHAEIARRGERFVVIDLESINGTTLNGTRLIPGRPEVLYNGDVVVFGRVKLIIS